MDSMLEILNNCLKDSNIETISKADLRKKYLEKTGLTKLPKEDKELFASAVNTAYLNFVANNVKAVHDISNKVIKKTSENEMKENGEGAMDSSSDEDITSANINEKVLADGFMNKISDVKMEHSSDSDEMPLSSYKKDVKKSSDKQRAKRRITSSSEDEIIPNKSTKKNKVLKKARKSCDSGAELIKPEAKKRVIKSTKNKNNLKKTKLESSDSEEEEEPLSVFQGNSNSRSQSSLMNKSDLSEEEGLIKYLKKQSSNAIHSENEPVMTTSKNKSKSIGVSEDNSSDSEDEPIAKFKKSDESMKSKIDSSDSEDESLAKFKKFNSPKKSCKSIENASESDDELVLSLGKKKSNLLSKKISSESESENDFLANSESKESSKNLSASKAVSLNKLNNKKTSGSNDYLNKPVKKTVKREVKHSLQKLNGNKSEKQTSKKSIKKLVDSDEEEDVSSQKKRKFEQKDSLLSDSSEDEPLSKKETKSFSDSENELLSNITKISKESDDEPLVNITKKMSKLSSDSEDESLASAMKKPKKYVESEDEALTNKTESESEVEPPANITKKELKKSKVSSKEPVTNNKKSLEQTLNKKKRFVDSEDDRNTANEEKEESFEEPRDSFCSDSDEDEPLSNVTKKEPKNSSDSESETLNKLSIKKLGRKQKCSESDSSSCVDENEDHSNEKIKPSKKKNTKDSEKMKNRPSASENKIEHLKKYVRTAGIRIQNYNKFFENCKTMKAKYEKLMSLLEKEGLKGRPTLEKCKKLRKKIETKREIAELDLSNILKEGGGRPKRSICSDTTNCKPEVENSTPLKKFSRLQDIIDSEESD